MSQDIMQRRVRAFFATLILFLVATLIYQIHRVDERLEQMRLQAEEQDRKAAEIEARLQQQKFIERANRANAILAKYPGADTRVIMQALDAAERFQYKDFPRAQDIITIIGIESSWRVDVMSQLSTDRAYGLTQIRPATWSDVIGEDDIRDVDTQVRAAADILHHYYMSLNKSKAGAILSYNNGITAYVNGAYTKDYLYKFWREVAYVEKKVFA